MTCQMAMAAGMGQAATAWRTSERCGGSMRRSRGDFIRSLHDDFETMYVARLRSRFAPSMKTKQVAGGRERWVAS
jgi:hypothetical protein